MLLDHAKPCLGERVHVVLYRAFWCDHSSIYLVGYLCVIALKQAPRNFIPMLGRLTKATLCKTLVIKLLLSFITAKHI